MALLCTIFRDLWNVRTTICKGILTPHNSRSLKIIALQNIQSKYYKQPRHNNKVNMAEVDPKRIDGVAIGGQIRAEIKKEVESLKAAGKRVPGIGVILVGDRKDSTTYVNMKQKACVEAGIHFVFKKLSDQASQDDIINAVKELNADANVDGILVQLPLPAHVNEKTVLLTVDPAKDVDGFHPENIGAIALKGHEAKFVPCTPKGCMELLKRLNIPVAGKHAVVLGRSNIVGVPMALLLLQESATVTVCHSRTENLPDMVRQADIIVAAVGKAQMVKQDWVKPGAIVIDVGINSIDDPSRPNGYRLVGDVDYQGVHEVAGRITPVPGGVGPMTIAMLLQNTLKGYQQNNK
jgi:5,10-methylene-tetrahydrofolate dehydrogenase/methenyl tetrahydrofolate cyclohydrolase